MQKIHVTCSSFSKLKALYKVLFFENKNSFGQFHMNLARFRGHLIEIDENLCMSSFNHAEY